MRSAAGPSPGWHISTPDAKSRHLQDHNQRDKEDIMDEFFDGFVSGPRTARCNHIQGEKRKSQARASKTQRLNDEFFAGFFAGPRASQ
jgi:hypothetical protein